MVLDDACIACPNLDTTPVIRPIPRLRAFLIDSDSGTQYELNSRIIEKGPFINYPRNVARDNGVEIAYRAVPTVPNYRSNQIAYGVEGLETFNLDIPDALRGKLATLRFELDRRSNTVYLDDVSFQSNHLLLGNPTSARIRFDPAVSETENDNRNITYQDNYLMEKPQYTIAYSRTDNTPIWASWQLNQTWFGSFDREPFEIDLKLPDAWYRVKPDDYDRQNLGELQIPGTNDPDDGMPFEYQPGHVVPAADRDRNRKDSYEVALLSNIIPQHEKTNSPVWLGLEQFSRNLVQQRGRELYIIAGGGGSRGTVGAFNDTPRINVPDYFWKVIVVLDRPGQGIADIGTNTQVIAVVSPNEEPPLTGGTSPKYQRWYQGGMRIVTVRALENMLNAEPINQARGIHYNFLSNVSQQIQDVVENQPFIPGNDPLDAFPLLSANL